MIKCTIGGCDEFWSETFSDKADAQRWIIIRACRCGAYNQAELKSCTCKSEGYVPISYWPNLDWWAFGGVEEVVLCPLHRPIVAGYIREERGQDPSMNPTQRSPYNRH